MFIIYIYHVSVLASLWESESCNNICILLGYLLVTQKNCVHVSTKLLKLALFHIFQSICMCSTQFCSAMLYTSSIWDMNGHCCLLCSVQVLPPWVKELHLELPFQQISLVLALGNYCSSSLSSKAAATGLILFVFSNRKIWAGTFRNHPVNLQYNS